MSQLKVNAISDAAGANGNAITLATDGTCTAKVTNNLSNRNLVINGGMTVGQRMNSSNTGGVNLTGYQTVDRFSLNFNGTNNAPTQHHVDVAAGTTPYTLGFRKKYQITNGDQTSNDADDQMFIKYKVEAQDIANSGWDYTSASSKITLSFWLQTSANQTFYGYVYLPDGGNSAHRLYSFSFTASGNNAWTKITKTIPGGGTSNVINNDNGVGLEILLCPGTGGNVTASGSVLDAWKVLDDTSWFPDMATTWWDTNDATFEITGVQLEVGDTATDFEHRSYAEELVRCQRYCYKIDSPDATTNTSVFGIAFVRANNTFRWGHQWPQKMRTAPSLSVSAGSHFKVFDGSASEICNTVVIDNASAFSANISFGSSGTGMNVGRGCQVYANDTQIGWILLSAEL